MEEPGADEHCPTPTASPLPVWYPHLCATLPFLMSEMIRGSPRFLLAAVGQGRQAVDIILKGRGHDWLLVPFLSGLGVGRCEQISSPLHQFPFYKMGLHPIVEM